MNWINQWFRLRENQTSVLRELQAGTTTFITMSYIIFVQPAVLSACGMDFDSVMVATCLASAFATLLLGLWSNYPIALAPAMGHNFFFAFTVCVPLVKGGMGLTWQAALAANLIAGLIFAVLTMFKLQDILIRSVPDSIKNSIAVGIGLLISFLGMQWAGIVVAKPGTIVGLGHLGSAHVLLSLVGLVIILLLLVLKVQGAILIGIAATTVIGLVMGIISKNLGHPVDIVQYHGIVSAIPSIEPTLFKLSFSSLFAKSIISVITVVIIFLFLDIFDTMGTLIGLGEQANLLKDGTLPKAQETFLSDAAGTVAGAALGTSTVTSYIESAAGISAGGKTGLTSVFVSIFFLLALFFNPLVKMVGIAYTVNNVQFYPVIAPVLIVVGFLMMQNVTKIQWDNLVESIPSFLCLMIMPLTFSITEGIAFAFISYSLLTLVVGKFLQVHWLVHVFSLLFILRFIFLM